MRFVPNPRLRDELERSEQMRAALLAAGREIADRATPIGQQIARSYEAEASVDGDKVQVHARTAGIDASGWIEFGTADLPAVAPLRNGTQQAGLQLR